MKGNMITVIAASIAGIYAALQATISNYDIWAVLDKYGFPTAMLAVVILFTWNRQKKADGERNDLISANNELTQQVINAVKEGNKCKYYVEYKGEKIKND